MTLTQILADIYRRVGFASSPPSDVSTRVTAFVNETQNEILREAGMQWLQNETLTFNSAADRQVYGLPVQGDKLKTIRDATNSITLEAMSVEEYRFRYPDPAANTGLSTRWVDLGFDAVDREPSDASTIFVDSTSASDTGTAYLEGFLSNGQPFSVSVTMTGVTAVSFSPNSVRNISKFYISANAVGTVTLHEDAEGGTELARIPAGFSHSRYRRIALVPTPAATVTYSVDFEREVPDMANGTDQPVIPVKFHYLLSLGARMKEYEKTNDMARWSLAKSEYETGLRKLKFWVYQQSIGVPNMRGYAYSRPTLSDGGTLAQAGGAASSPHTAAEGGTGFSSYTIGDILSADTTTTLAKISAGAVGTLLAGTGAGSLPAWQSNIAIGGTLNVTGATTLDGAVTLGNAIGDPTVVSGTLNVVGATTLDGAVTLGNAAGDNVTVTGTLTSHLLFTDATYDIGASGATRPRDFFFSRNGTIGGTLGVSGVATLTGQAILTNGLAVAGDAAVARLTHGTFAPTLTNTTNVAASTAFTCQFLRVGNVVHVSGKVNIDPTAANTATVLGMSLPVSSDLAAEEQLAGAASAVTPYGYSAGIRGDTANNRASFAFVSDSGGADTSFYFTFSYLVV